MNATLFNKPTACRYSEAISSKLQGNFILPTGISICFLLSTEAKSKPFLDCIACRLHRRRKKTDALAGCFKIDCAPDAGI